MFSECQSTMLKRQVQDNKGDESESLISAIVIYDAYLLVKTSELRTNWQTVL